MIYFVNVVIDIALDSQFTYSSDKALTIGQRLLVEFNKKKIIGFVWNNIATEDLLLAHEKIKPVLIAFDFIIPIKIIELIKFSSKYYHYPIGSTLFSVIPSLLKAHTDKSNIAINNIHKKLLLYSNDLNMQNHDVASDVLNIDDADHNLQVSSTCLSVTNNKPNQISNINNNHVKKLNRVQLGVMDFIANNWQQPIILHGITGSGKTEIYINLIKTIISNNQQALLLVPEINLTPLILDRFMTNLPTLTIAVLTSNTTANKRYLIYQQAKNNQLSLIIGTRTAIFTPFYNLGIIIVDEEHDASFKQNERLRYNARDLAVFRAHSDQIPLVLGSATPSLESYYNYQINKYKLCNLDIRADPLAVLPDIKIVDLNVHDVKNGFSKVAIELITDRLAKQELSLIYINRRGYAPVIKCHHCNCIIKCKHCSSNMVYHLIGHLQCHFCHTVNKIPATCPLCNSIDLRCIGQGTQKIEATLLQLFPTARILRIDRDIINSKKAWEKIYHTIHNKEADILIGTQMLNKGHDFHDITLVVGIDLDGGLYSYDFRASHTLFTQLMQVGGRAGRGQKHGTVLLQTNYPQHYIYKYLIKHDYIGFIKHIMQERKQLYLPPYNNYVILRASGNSNITILEFLNIIFITLNNYKINHIKLFKETTIFNPINCYMQKINNKERAQILITSKDRQQLHQFLNETMQLIVKIKKHRSISWYLDVDPLDI